jgi:type II secretory ATPase GspE/PulE/Tfp pilus assembly ATPase PilB-like protein
VADIVDVVIQAGVRLGASDIHLEPASDRMMLRMRLDGVMQGFGAVPAEIAPNIVARCKVMADLLTYRCNVPQEGGTSGDDYAPGLDLRISTYPTLHGERVAIRLFDSDSRLRRLKRLGLPHQIESALAAALSAPEGLILLSGPSGSGKTTTLYACLNEIRDSSHGGRHIVTVEDPIENEIPGATQTAVNPSVDLTFPASLRSLLRQDPEVIMVGEIRDGETAHIAVEAALTGHLVLSTVHAPRAALVPHRLLDMGVRPYALAGALTLVLSQRLVRKLCQECCRPASSEERDALPAGVRESGRVAVGCATCQHTGYNGRLLLAELVESSDKLHDAIMERSSRREFLNAASQAEDLVSMARDLVRRGQTTAFEVQRVLGTPERHAGMRNGE